MRAPQLRGEEEEREREVGRRCVGLGEGGGREDRGGRSFLWFEFHNTAQAWGAGSGCNFQLITPFVCFNLIEET